ncbi:hypothetical protein [Cellulomonas sp. PhB143]|nr:hypothetical protein [Cellulomonas sp. PhB143]ROS74500.1 hypothetical protein EDF32_2247 [Cellulomonas sp. PhB143]
MSTPDERHAEGTPRVPREHPEYDEPHLLEDDETVPPRPEEEVADADR